MLFSSRRRREVKRVGAARTEIEKMVLDVIENETNVRESNALEMHKRMQALVDQVSGRREGRRVTTPVSNDVHPYWKCF